MKPANEPSKQKKITVSFFLNRKLKPTGITSNENGEAVDMYPLYLSITYNRKNMQFKSNYSMPYSDEREIEKGLKAFEERLITKIILYETSFLKSEDEYDMKGLKERYEVYAISLFTSLEKYLKPRLRLEILKTNDELFKILDLNKGAGKNSVVLLYKGAGRLFENFNQKMDKGLREDIEVYEKLLPLLQVANYEFPTLMDWLDGSYEQELKTLLPKENKKDKEFIDKAIKLIGDAVMQMIKETLRQMGD